MATVSFKEFAQGKPVTVVGNETTPEVKTSLLSRFDNNSVSKYLGKPVLNAVEDAGEKINQGLTDVVQGSKQKSTSQAIQQAGRGALGALSGVVGGATAPIAPILEPLGKEFQKIGESTVKKEGQTDLSGGLMDKITNLPSVQKFAINNPNAGEVITDLVNVIGAILGARKAPEAIESASRTAVDIIGKPPGPDMGGTGLKGSLTPLIDNVKNAPKDIFNKIKTLGKTEPNDLEIISEKIAPKPTVKEVKNAMAQGRLYSGSDPTALRGTSGGKIAASDQQFKTTQTIYKNIPDAAKMDDPTLYSALSEKIGETARNLKPEMQKIPVNRETTGKAFEKWKELKTSRAQNADFVDNLAGNKALQTQFENHLKDLEWDIMDKTGKFKSPTPKTLDDVWETAIKYDNSVPDNVKQATSISDSKLQFRKEMWLENRAILRNILTDAENGLGKTAKDAFIEMRDMYEGQNGLLSKAKVEKPQSSKIMQAVKNNPLVKTTIKAVGLGTGLQLLP